ncbi:MAG TPA: hypothetical protein ENG87_05825 [Candidatus Pacearchaeota archaeon]|nr:hypothetical protein BMS3Abin17_00083 [archaeon BMS3Abin17]HDK42874.1 hypothetical protein [Candidatus Pacearchaeota archaeon]HDZ60169.1 hypothetical protein [Candidatus Pacearchaeota archaeon]
MDTKRLLREIVILTKNSKTKQNSLHIKAKKLKELDMNIEDLLNMPINKKIKKFERGDNYYE